MRVMTSGASLAHGLVFEDKRSPLGRMALAASIVLREQGGSSAANGRAFVRVVAIATAHFPIKNRMSVGQVKLRSLVEMALKTNVRRLFGIDNGVARPTALTVNAACAMARFAAGVLRVRPLGFDPLVRRHLEITHNFGMTLTASLGTDKFRARDLGWGNQGACRRGT